MVDWISNASTLEIALPVYEPDSMVAVLIVSKVPTVAVEDLIVKTSKLEMLSASNVEESTIKSFPDDEEIFPVTFIVALALVMVVSAAILTFPVK